MPSVPTDVSTRGTPVLIALLLVLLGLVVVASTLGPALGRVPPNTVVGIRTRATQRNPVAWRAGHRRAARVTVPVGLAASALGTVLAAGWVTQSAATVERVAMIGLGAVVLASVAGAFLGDREARRHS